MIINPHMLPKIRSSALTEAIQGMPCSLRISNFIPGHNCASDSTVVGCHLPVFGKGVATKVSDLYVVAGCQHCHDLIDGRDSRVHWLNETYPSAFHSRMLMALAETQARLLMADIITVKGAEIV